MDKGEELEQLWTSKWWLDEQYARAYRERASPEQIDRVVRRVAEVFDPRWARSRTQHPFYQWILGTGTMVLEFLIGLGQDLETVEGSKRFSRIIKGLRHPTDCQSAMLTLEIAAVLKRSGHEIEFDPPLPNGKWSDLVARLEGQQVYFEIKRMQESQRRQAVEQLMISVGSSLSDLFHTPKKPGLAGAGYRVALAPELAKRFGRGWEADNVEMKNVTELIIQEISKRVDSGQSLEFVIPSVATVIIGDTGRESSGLTGPPFYSWEEMERIFRRIVKEGIHQLHPDFPGIITVQTPGYLSPAEVRDELDARLDWRVSGAEHLSAVIFFPVYYSLPQRWSVFHSFAVLNPRARVRAETLKAVQDLRAVYENKAKTPADR